MRIRSIDLTEAMEPLAEYAKRADEGPVVVTAAGRPLAVVLPIENADLETVSLSTNPRFVTLIERSRTRRASG